MRLIDADALINDWHFGTSCNSCERDAYKCQYHETYSVMDVCGMIEDAPTVDAVQVVRCKDCEFFRRFAEKAFEQATDGYCCYNDNLMYDEDYCSDGERKEE